jgi:5'-nucleotidase
VLDDVPKYAALVREIREETDNVLLLDGGDIFRRGPFSDYLGEVEISVMNAMGYDALVFGNNDFHRRGELSGISQHPIINLAEFPVLCANVFIDGELLPGFAPYVILEAGGLDIAVIGVTSMKPRNRNEYPSEWAVFTEPDEAVMLILDDVSGISDIQIVLSHAGIDMDLLMRGVSAIIGGDDHLRLTTPSTVRDGDLIIPVVQAGGEDDHYLGRLDLGFAEIDGTWVLQTFNGRLLDIEGVQPDDGIQQIIDSYLAETLGLAG